MQTFALDCGLQDKPFLIIQGHTHAHIHTQSEKEIL